MRGFLTRRRNCVRRGCAPGAMHRRRSTESRWPIMQHLRRRARRAFARAQRALVAAGVLAGRARSVARRGRAAARSDPWRHGDQRRHGAGQGCGQEAARPRAKLIAAKLRADASDRQGRGRRARLHQSHAQAGRLDRGAARAILRRRATYGRSRHRATAQPVNVEYVSANPTGPMHVGHGRGAVFGDALANLLRSPASR